MFKKRLPKGPKAPKGPKKPQKFAVAENKTFLKQFSMDVKSYKSIKSKDDEDGLLLYGMPVFKAGKHREFDYSQKWIDQFLIGQFDASEDVPIQRDHSDESYATLGYVKKLYRDGDMVYADMLLIDDTAISRWKKGLMKKWSVGISREMKLAEISAVAFPYIKEARVHSDSENKEESLTLSLTKKDDKFSLIVHNEDFDLGESKSFSAFYESLKKGECLFKFNVDKDNNICANYLEEGEFKMELEELKKQFAELQTKLDDTNKANEQYVASMKAKDDEIAKYKEAEVAAQFAALKSSVETEVKDLIKAGKIAPAREKSLVEVLCKLSEDARKEMVVTFSESGKISELGETGSQKSEKDNGTSFKDGEGKFEFDGKVHDLNVLSAEEINDLAEKYAKKNDLGFSEAMDVIYAKARPNA